MILAICNSKGGVFKTGTTLNLATLLSSYKPILVDLDSQKSITYLNNIRQQYSKPLDVITVHTEKELEIVINKSTKDNLYIIDTGGFDSSLTRIAIITADVLVSPTSGNVVDLLGLNRFEAILKELSEVKGETIKTNVFINDVSPATKKFDEIQDFITSSENFNLLNSIIRTRADFPNAINKGLTVKEFNPVGKATIEFKFLAKEIELLLSKI
ncbi:MAG: ParA family protein [Sphingobacteriaceae bacterium]|nr:ParA family protein [Sphingobacteriaceae bacterium]